jgi:dTDP-4-dehydrorhamnose 3,5-epimerase-like enzyme
LLNFPKHGDSRGELVVLEGGSTVPFEIKRVFYIYGSDADVVRGCHANRDSEFLLVNVHGSSKVRVVDVFGSELVVSLDSPQSGVYLPRMLWKEMYGFSRDSVLAVFASTHYDASEYIRDYDEFLGMRPDAK